MPNIVPDFYMNYFIKFSHVTEKPYEADYFTHFADGEIGGTGRLNTCQKIHI